MPVPADDPSLSESLYKFPAVDIGDEGTFKYVLIEAYATETAPGKN